MHRHLPLALVATFLALVVGATAGAAGDAGASGMTPRQLSTLQSMSSVAISPDGAQIAAVRSVPRELFVDDDGRARSELHVVDFDDGSSRPFITGAVSVSDVQWLPDGRAVSFLAKRGDDENTALYTIPVDGGEARQVLSLDEDINTYSWAPDGARVAVVASEPQSEDEKELEEDGFTQTVFEEDWRPRRVWVATVGADGGEPEALELDGSVFQVRWSPDGDHLAIDLAPSPLVDDRYMYRTIHVVTAEDGEVVATVDHSGKLGRFEWAPDGRHLAFSAGVDLHDPAVSSLFVVGVGGGTPRNLTPGFEGSVSAFAWGGNTTLVLLADVGVETDLYQVESDGSDLAPQGLKGSGAVFTRMSVARDGRSIALVGESPQHPSEVFAAALGEVAPRRLTSSNPWLDTVALARQEVIRHSARDDLELEGLLIYPLDYEQGTRYPLVMVVHGGPEGHRRNGWLTRYSSPGQILAARGFAVFFPNYRGGTGRGVEFSKLGQADPAGREFDDLVDAVDHLVSVGLVDGDRVGITGGSYGGYATAWCATRYSERFAAGVMFVGISNKISKFGTTDIPVEEYLVHARKLVYDAFDFFRERSPIFHAHKGRTPLLVLHGEDDPRVSVTQSEEMYRALKTLKQTPVRLVLYPGEGHGNRRAASRYDVCLRLLRWMEHYLRGPGGDVPPRRLDYRSPEDGWEPS